MSHTTSTYLATLALCTLAFSAQVSLADSFERDKIKADIELFHKDPKGFYGTSPTHSALESKVNLPTSRAANFEEFLAKQVKTDNGANKDLNFSESINWPLISRDWRSFDDPKNLRGSSATKPWSDTYWPIAAGGISNRYADPNMSTIPLENWIQALAYISQPAMSLATIADSKNAMLIDSLSPAEKYDLLIGDAFDPQGARFSDKFWLEGASYYRSQGSVATWMGICHGWSPASFRVPRPQHAVTVLAADHVTPITFYPSDIKALTSQLWSRAMSNGIMLGQRCPEPKPTLDPATGRPINPACLGVDPADWHLVNLFQIGTLHDGLVTNVSKNSEVWNQPQFAYEFSYFNPRTGTTFEKLSEAKIALSEFANDPFRKYRHVQTAEVVGVAMKISYGEETSPNHHLFDSAKDDETKDSIYYYDLEIDSDHKIIGGEWYQAKHPGFVTVERPLTFPQSSFSSYATGSWNPADVLPQTWIYAAKGDRDRSEVLSQIVKQLVSWSSN